MRGEDKAIADVRPPAAAKTQSKSAPLGVAAKRVSGADSFNLARPCI
jgi:hypothetical protein